MAGQQAIGQMNPKDSLTARLNHIFQYIIAEPIPSGRLYDKGMVYINPSAFVADNTSKVKAPQPPEGGVNTANLIITDFSFTSKLLIY